MLTVASSEFSLQLQTFMGSVVVGSSVIQPSLARLQEPWIIEHASSIKQPVSNTKASSEATKLWSYGCYEALKLFVYQAIKLSFHWCGGSAQVGYYGYQQLHKRYGKPWKRNKHWNVCLVWKSGVAEVLGEEGPTSLQKIDAPTFLDMFEIKMFLKCIVFLSSAARACFSSQSICRNNTASGHSYCPARVIGTRKARFGKSGSGCLTW